MHIEFKEVTMVYADRPAILKEVSFAIPANTRLALIGPSGAGKSTIASLIIRRSDPTEGVICINGIPLSKYNLSSVLAHIGVILQRPEIISGSVRENILLTTPTPLLETLTDKDVWEIIDRISPEMRTRFCTEGLDTRVGKQGLQLSGGEQQRLCVMRALIKKPEFLIVDEATSSLDSSTEEEVQEGIDVTLSLGISALIIAHRFSTLRQCNRFLVLRNARECNHDQPQIEAVAHSLQELYATSVTFRRLADTQGFIP